MKFLLGLKKAEEDSKEGKISRASAKHTAVGIEAFRKSESCPFTPAGSIEGAFKGKCNYLPVRQHMHYMHANERTGSPYRWPPEGRTDGHHSDAASQPSSGREHDRPEA